MGTNAPKMGTKATSARRIPPAPSRGATRKRRASFADALFTRTQQRVLGLLFGRPDRSFFAREIIACTRAGSGAVQRELERLTECGIIVMTRIGRQTHFQANRAAPIFSELHGIVMKTIGLAEPLGTALASLADRIELAFVYGSIAKGEDRADSDIDLLVVGDDVTLEELFARLARVEKTLGRKINPTLYSAAEFRRGNAFLKKVLSGATIPLIGNADGAVAAR